MSLAPGAQRGRLVWEVVETATGHVQVGERDLELSDFEVMVSPPPAPPRFDLVRRELRQVAAEAVGWLVRAGRGSTTKRVRLAEGFWLVLRELMTPSAPSLVTFSAAREGVRTSCVQRYRLDEGSTTAAEVDGQGSLDLVWAQNQDGFQEILSTTVVTDLELRLRPARGPLGRAPLWQVRLRAGSVVHWPPSADGVRLTPRLRPRPGGA